MVLVVVLSVDLVKDIIKTNFNRYFKCLDIVDYIVAYRHEVSLKHVMNCRKQNHDPYYEGRINLSGEVTWVLKLLKAEGVIKKYNGRTWEILK